MAYIECPDCKKRLPETVTACTSCGSQLPAESKDKLKDEYQRAYAGKHIGGGVGAAVGAALIGGAAGLAPLALAVGSMYVFGRLLGKVIGQYSSPSAKDSVSK